MITTERLRELLDYNPETGVFRWRAPRRGVMRKSAGVAGVLFSKGYRYIGIEGRKYYAHRLAWFYAHGRWPACQIDHINGLRDDNRIANLREATSRDNNRNSKPKVLGRKGIRLMGRKWAARIKVDGRGVHLGMFATAEAAHAAYRKAAAEYFGKFARFE